jgi:sigma-B regulation protein RsbU (phosphoserine phosphatase)
MNAKSLEFLVEASKVLNSTLNVNSLVCLVYDLITSAVDCEVCSLGRLGEKGEKIGVLLALGRTGPEITQLTVDKSRGIMGQVVRTGKPLILNNPEEISSYPDAIDQAVPFEKKSALGVPLMRGSEIIGALEAVNKRTGDFTEDDARLLSALSDQVAIALDNARLHARLIREKREKDLLYEVGVRISSSLDMEEVMGLILQCLKEVVEYHAGGVFLVDPDSMEIMRLTAHGYAPGMEDWVKLKFGQGVVGWVARHAEPAIIGDVSKDSRYLSARPSTRSEIVVPLLVGDRIVGLINLENDDLDAFTSEDLDLIRTFGTQAAISIERARLHRELVEKRRLEHELELARSIQQTFLPERVPEITGYDLSAINLPSEEVSGDYYDVIYVTEDQWGIVVADVFGKGIPASLVMASFRASLLAEIRNNYSIGTIMAKVNRLIWESVEPERCVTACYGVLDARARVLTYSNAGHFYPLILRGSETIRLERGGMILGVLEDTKYEEGRVDLRSGDLLLFFTDGLTEAESPDGEPFGEDRLIEAARSGIGLSCADLVQRIHKNIYGFSDGRLIDDFTLIAMKVE